MRKLFMALAVGAVAAMIPGCAIFVETPDTTEVRVINQLQDVTLTINNTNNTVSAVDFYGVDIDGAYFSFVGSGSTTSYQTTNGAVTATIYIDSCDVTVRNLVEEVTYVYTVFPVQLTSTLLQGSQNTVYFDRAFAEDLLAGASKKRVK